MKSRFRNNLEGVKIGEPFNPYRVFLGSFLPNALLRYDGLSSTDKLVWARLAQYAGERGYCYPSYDQLAQELGISSRSAIRSVDHLIKERFIAKIEENRGGAGRVNLYRFLFHECLDQGGRRAPDEQKTVTKSHCSNGDKMSPITVTNLVENGDKMSLLHKGVKRFIRESSLSQGEREIVEKDLKRLLPGITSLPQSVSSERAFLFWRKVLSGEIRKDELYSPVAYMVKMMDEDIGPLLERWRASLVPRGG